MSDLETHAHPASTSTSTAASSTSRAGPGSSVPASHGALRGALVGRGFAEQARMLQPGQPVQLERARVVQRSAPPAPPRYAAIEPALVDLLWRSRHRLFAAAHLPEDGTNFWETLDAGLGLGQLQTLVQVARGARDIGLWPTIAAGELTRIYDHGSSYGIHYVAAGSPRSIVTAAPSEFGIDISQGVVRSQHGNTLHEWWRHRGTGPGARAMHVGLDVGAGDTNLHWDTTNPTIVVQGRAIPDPASLRQHAMDIGFLPGGDRNGPTQTQPEPFFSIDRLAETAGFLGRVVAQERGEAAVHDRARLAQVAAEVGAVETAVHDLQATARPLAGTDMDAHRGEVAALRGRLVTLRTAMQQAAAELYRYLGAEEPRTAPLMVTYGFPATWALPGAADNAREFYFVMQRVRRASPPR